MFYSVGLKLRLVLLLLLATGVTQAAEQVTHGWLDAYTDFVENVVDEQYSNLVDLPASRLNRLCPSWENLNDAQKTTFWSSLVWTLAFYESSFYRNAILREPGNRIDPLTKHRLHSEGLLQLSYGDTKNYRYPFDDISWKQDKNKAIRDYQRSVRFGNKSRTLLDAYSNLNFGLWIISANIERHPHQPVEQAMAHYWSTIKPTGKLFKDFLNSLTDKAPFCF